MLIAFSAYYLSLFELVFENYFRQFIALPKWSKLWLLLCLAYFAVITCAYRTTKRVSLFFLFRIDNAKNR